MVVAPWRHEWTMATLGGAQRARRAAAHTEYGTPFNRIAAGTERRLELEPLAQAPAAVSRCVM
jgi:hypothetical protein